MYIYMLVLLLTRYLQILVFSITFGCLDLGGVSFEYCTKALLNDVRPWGKLPIIMAQTAELMKKPFLEFQQSR